MCGYKNTLKPLILEILFQEEVAEMRIITPGF